MESLIDVINKLHDTFATVQMEANINLLQIAVVGSQSSGKSSVLEAIVGKDFLPRGSGIVTRCPLVLQLVQLPKTNDDVEWGEFLHKPGQKYTDFSEIHKEILSRTEEIAGKTNIISTPINLKVYSRHVLNLTLVDLPGLVVNAVGDQPKDIACQIRDMVTQYVSHENTIILAVLPANADIATSASLQLAKEIDPEGVRTVGVLTKLDLMDKGTDAMDILTGRLMPLRHGYVGVVNRSQQDINYKKGMQASRDDELAFFNKHKAYSAIAEQHGTEFLTKKLNQLLLKHIKTVIPDLKSHIDNLIVETHTRRERVGMPNQDDSDFSNNMLFLIKLFCDAVIQSIGGSTTSKTKELVGKARLNYVLYDWFTQQLESLNAADELTDEYIYINSRNMDNLLPTLLPFDKVFVNLVTEPIARLEEPSQNCVTHIYNELLKTVEESALKLDRFPLLKQAVCDVCRNMLQEYMKSAQLHVETVISAESTFITVRHPKINQLAQQVLQTLHSGLSTNNEEENTEDPITPKTAAFCVSIRVMVKEYFAVVKESVADQVPKAIVFLMVNKLLNNVFTTLVGALHKEEKVKALMAESPEVAQERATITKRMDALTRAKSVLDSVEGYTLTDKSCEVPSKKVKRYLGLL